MNHEPFATQVLNNTEPTNLTDMQLLIWAGQKLRPEVPAYNMVFTFTIGGAIQPDRFQAAWTTFVARSDALRTVIEEVEGVPHQRILAQLPYTMDYLDFSARPDAPAAGHSRCEERARRPLHLDQRLFDTALLKIGPERFIWYLNVHHILSDGWGYALIYRRLMDFYQLSLQDRLTEAPNLLSFPLNDERGMMNDELKNPSAIHHSSFIIHHSSDPLSFYGNATADRSAGERRITCALGIERSQRLRALTQREDIRLLNVHLSLLSIFSALLFTYLYRISGSRRLVMGMPFHSRRTETARQTIGILQEVFPLQMEIAEDDTFISLIQKSRQGIWDILRQGHLRSETGHNQAQSAFDVILNYPNVSFPPFHGLPTQANWLHTGFGDGRRSLFLQIQDFNETGNLTLHFDGNEAVFSADQQQQATVHFLNVLDHFLANPTQPIEEVSLLSAAERERILVGFNQTARSYPADQTLADLFQAQVQRTPDAVALVFGGETLTYSQLNTRANQLAYHLRARGVGPGVLVAVCAERSLELVIGLLAIFKAGGVYAPLDPSYPQERLAFMLADSQARVLLTQTGLGTSDWGLTHDQPNPQSPMVVYLDTVGPALTEGPLTNPVSGVTLADLAYVIYTSGSTGRPKGVAMSQRALVNLIWWQMTKATRLRAPRTLQFTPLSFDVSLQETFSCWCSGGALVLISEETRRDPEATLRLLIDERIEQLFIIFTPLQQLAEASGRLGLAPVTLREVITAGEQVQVTPVVAHFFARLPDCTFQNQYGPSETHIVTAYPLEGPVSDWPALPPIGRPIANTEIYILDSRRQPVPVGVAGELYIGGAQVAEGYLNRPELTAERFIPNPFIESRGAAEQGSRGAEAPLPPCPPALRRLYKTGDLARWRPDGNIEFLGRMDHQVKVRGYRIELGEIEAVLTKHPAVREAVVVARQDSPGDKRLVAYVVPSSQPLTTAELRDHLRRRLPEYMVPSAFLLLETLPQTPNGKVDRRALPAPTSLHLGLDTTAYVPPQTELERAIAAIWQEVLQLERVGLHDNFLDLGGNSLLMIQAHHKLQERLACNLSVIELFQYPTVEALVTCFGRLGQEAGLNGETGPSRSTAADRARERARKQREALQRRKGGIRNDE
ncbi:MAG: amino acid adenylation domain-containing protein [Chloroflexota bacterium]